MTILIEPYDESMLAEMRSIWNGVIEAGEAFVYQDGFSQDAFARLVKEQSAVYCLLLGGAVNGFYILHPNLPGRGAHIANASYAVKSDARGKGFGRLLAEHSLETARDLGFEAIQFNAVVSTNQGANHLWQSLGFTQNGMVPRGFRRKNGDYADLNLYHKTL